MPVCLDCYEAPASQAEVDARPICLFTDQVDAPTTSVDGTEDTLYTHTLAAGQLAANGDRVDFFYVVSHAAHATATRETKFYFGGTAIADFPTGAQASGVRLALFGSIIRVSATAVRAVLEVVGITGVGAVLGGAVLHPDLTGLTLSNTQIIKTTGIAAGTGAAPGDITARGLTLTYTPAP